MKILHAVESYFPAVGGMQEVVKQLSERMAKNGYDVTVVTRKHEARDFSKKNGVKIIDFNISGNLVNGIIGEKDKYENLLLNNDFDVIVFFATQQWATDVALPILDKIKAKKVCVPTGYSGLYWPEYKTYFENMKSWIHGFDMNVYLSDNYRDINFAKLCDLKNRILIPNGAAVEEFDVKSTIDVRKELGIPADHFLLLHVGSYTGVKGHNEAMEIFYKSNLKKATFLMIGNNYEAFKKHNKFSFMFFLRKVIAKYIDNKEVVFSYFPRPFTVAAYQQANLFLFPSNIECSPIVLFESAAAHLPFLTTDCGNATEIVKWTEGGELIKTIKKEDGFVLADINASVKQLEELFLNKNKLKQLGENGYKNWKLKFTWEKISNDYINLYQQLIKQTS